MPFLGLLAATMVSHAFSEGPSQVAYPLGTMVALSLLYYYRRDYQDCQVTGSLAVFGLGLLVFVVWIGAVQLLGGYDSGDRVVADGQGSHPAGFWGTIRLLGYVFLTPVIEELAFRGYLLRRLIASDFQNVSLRTFTWTSFLGSSLLFGLAHGENWFAATIAGMAYAAAAQRRGALGDAMIAHGTTNTLLAICAGLSGNWHLIG